MFAGLVAVARRVDRLPCPTVFAAHALCLTWAFELALACDLILAAESASFGLVEKVIGLTPAMGGTQRLAERAGTGRAREFVMAGRPFGAAELERWNVVNRVLPDDGFDAAARQYAASSRRGPRWPMPRPSRCCATTSRVGSSWPTSGSRRSPARLFDYRRPAGRGAVVSGPRTWARDLPWPLSAEDTYRCSH